MKDAAIPREGEDETKDYSPVYEDERYASLPF